MPYTKSDFVRNDTSDPASDNDVRTMSKAAGRDCFESRRSPEQELTFTAAAGQFSKRHMTFDM